MAVMSSEEAARYRELVRSRLSQRNVISAIAAVIGGCVALGGSLYTGTTGPTIALLAGPATMVLWHVHSYLRPQALCPQCGDNWEYDALLRATACETCELPLPTADVR